VTAENPIAELLAAPLSPDWSIEGLAEQVLGAIAARPGDEQLFVFDAATAKDRQSQRMLRPLLACLATKSAAETGTSTNLYEGRLSFKRVGVEGPVWIQGEFENKPGSVRVVLRRSTSPQSPESKAVEDLSKPSLRQRNGSPYPEKSPSGG
jgi:hypothetical protein